MCIALHEKYPLFFSNFNESRVVSTDVSKNAWSLMKICPMGTELFLADDWTDG